MEIALGLLLATAVLVATRLGQMVIEERAHAAVLLARLSSLEEKLLREEDVPEEDELLDTFHELGMFTPEEDLVHQLQAKHDQQVQGNGMERLGGFLAVVSSEHDKALEDYRNLRLDGDAVYGELAAWMRLW